MIDISIIIPCYNSGCYLVEALDSVHDYKGVHSYEIIIIDDGSTDQFTIELLEKLSTKYVVQRQENKGPATARNTGCRIAKGKYLLFLDSDNKIIPDYIDIGISNLELNAEAGVVYSKAIFFGNDAGRKKFVTLPFNINELLITNYIDTCTVVKKETWKSVGGFDESPEMFTLEDWDFWLRIYEKGWKFIFIDKELFYYRFREGSLMDGFHKSVKVNDRMEYIFNRHSLLLASQHQRLYRSLDYRIGSKLLHPYRFIKRIIKKI